MNIKIFVLIICILFSDTKKLLNKQKKIVNLAFGINNNSIDLLYIALFSLLENSDNNTIYNIYIQHKNSFLESSKKFLCNLERKFFNCFIHFINMKRDFKNAFRNHMDISTYYRIKLPTLCPDINRIIHLDADVIVLKDLLELFSLNFEKNYILGRLDAITSELDSLGVHTNTYINAGILLMDLYNLRKYNYVEKFMNYINSHNNYKYLWHHAQTTINYICHDKIGILKPRYHMWPFNSEEHLIIINNVFRKKYNEAEFIKDFYNPFIVHFPGSFKPNIKSIYHNKFNEYKIKIEELKILGFDSLKNIINYYIFLIVIFLKIMQLYVN